MSMDQNPDSSIETLRSLSHALAAGIQSAELDVKRSNDQLGSLMYSKGLVDESLKILGTDGSGIYRQSAQATIFPSGSLALPICDQLKAAPFGSGKSVICNQILTTIQAGSSAFIAASPPGVQPTFDTLRQKLATHEKELLSLEDRLRARLLPYSEHLTVILDGALRSYRDHGTSTRFVNAGNSLRELVREFLAVIAPDEEVKNAPWFVPDSSSSSKVTRRHRLEFAIFKNLAKEKFPQEFARQAEETVSALLQNIGKLSAFTHVTENILDKDYTEAAPVFAEVMQQFLMLVSAVETARLLVDENIALEIQSHLDDLFTGDFFDELDSLSTHTRPQGASDVEVDEVTFDENWIEFSGSGSVDCDLQWGSDGDVERGDGLEGSNSFPFTFSGKVPIGDLSKIEIDKDDISIDTSSFYGEDSDE